MWMLITISKFVILSNCCELADKVAIEDKHMLGDLGKISRYLLTYGLDGSGP